MLLSTSSDCFLSGQHFHLIKLIDICSESLFPPPNFKLWVAKRFIPKVHQFLCTVMNEPASGLNHPL